MSRHRLIAGFLAFAIMADFVAMWFGWSAAATLLAWSAQGFGIGVVGVVGFWLLPAAAAAIVVSVSRLKGGPTEKRSIIMTDSNGWTH